MEYPFWGGASVRTLAYAYGVLTREAGDVKVLLVDDHVLFREGLKSLLRCLDAEVEMDEAGTCAEALECVATRSYDLVLLDLKMPGRYGLDALTALCEAVPDVPVVVLSGEDAPDTIRAAINLGAMGFIPKSSTPELLTQALRLVLAKGVYLPPAALDASPVPSETSRSDEAQLGITPRQLEVLLCVIQGKTNKEIARQLGIADGTVKEHLKAVRSRFGVRTRTAAVYAAAKLGLRVA